jgi:regulator of nonsense transcripts 2
MSDDAATADGDTDEGRLAEQPDPKADGEELDPIQSGPAARLNAIFAALPDASNRTLIDKLAVEFAFLNSKGARKRMYKVRFRN